MGLLCYHGSMGNGEEYLVTIYYREPTYERYHGAKEKPYHWTYRVRAKGEKSARDGALMEFREMARLSNVGWGREVESVEVCGVNQVPQGTSLPL